MVLKRYNEILLDDSFYIEEKINKLGHIYYLMVEDYKDISVIDLLKQRPNFKPCITKRRIRKSVAMHRINIDKIFIEKPDGYTF